MTMPARYTAMATIGIVLVAATIVAYWPVLSCDYVNVDDASYVFFNSSVMQGLSLEGLKYAATAIVCANWHPLTLLSLQLDSTLWGPKAAGYHATNLALHAINGLLLFAILSQLTRRIDLSGCVAAFFLLHPLHVESVAWISERKDVLSTCILLVVLFAYASFARRPSIGRYIGVFVLMALGLMAKPMLVTLPILLLLVDYWPLNRVRLGQPHEQPERFAVRSAAMVVGEKLPLLALSLADAIATILAQGDARHGVKHLTYPAQLANVFNSYFWYVQKTFVPSGLIAFYPHAGQNVAWTTVTAGLTLFCVMSAWAWQCRRTKPFLLFGWGWFVISLLPVVGIIQVGGQAYADRYAYIPHIGLFTSLVWELDSWIGPNRKARLAAGFLATLCLLVCGCMTYQQAGHWKDAETLWRHALSVDPNNGRAHLLLAGPLLNRGDNEQALHHIQEGFRLSTEKPVAVSYYNWALALISLSRDSEAEDKLRLAIKLEPENTQILETLLQLLTRQHRRDDAEKIVPLISRAYIKKAQQNPHSAKWQLAAGQIELQRGNVRTAMNYFERAVAINPREPLAQYNLGMALLQLGRYPEAKTCLQRTIELAPHVAISHFKLGELLEFENDLPGAKNEFAAAVELEPSNADFRQRLESLGNR